MKDLLKLREILEKNKEMIDCFESLIVASILLGYNVSIKELEHKKNIYFATTFIKNKKELHLDFSFNQKKELLEICTCNGDCKPVYFSDKLDKFKKTIELFRSLL